MPHPWCGIARLGRGVQDSIGNLGDGWNTMRYNNISHGLRFPIFRPGQQFSPSDNTIVIFP